MDDKDRYNPSKFLRDGQSSPELLNVLPGLNTPYKAAATPYDSDVPQLVVIMGKDGFKPGSVAYHLLQYSHIDAGEFGSTADGGQVFRYPFYGVQPKLLTVFGRNLLRTCHQIGAKRMPWIRLSDRDFRVVVGDDAEEPIITRIEVVDWKPQPKD